LTQAIAQRRGGPPPEQRLRAPRVERRVAHLAGPPLVKVDRSRVGGGRGQLVHNRPDTGRNPGADVDRARHAGTEGPHVGIRYVRDKDEVSSLVTVPTDLRSAAGQQPLAGDGHDTGLAGSILERAVDIRIAKRQRPHAEGPGKHPKVALGSLFRGPIGGERLGGGSLGCRQTGGSPVDGPTGGGEDEAAASGIGARLEDRDGPEHIDQGVADRVADGSRNPALGREVQDRVGPEADDGRGRGRAVDIGVLQLDSWWQRLTAFVTPVVDDQDCHVLGHQVPHGVHADEPRAARHEDARGSPQG